MYLTDADIRVRHAPDREQESNMCWLPFVLPGISLSSLRPRFKPFFREQWRKRQVLCCAVLLGEWRGFARRNRFAKSQSSSFFSSCARCPSVGLRRNKIKCGEEKTPLVFGDIAIVIGGERGERERERTAPKICELVAKR